MTPRNTVRIVFCVLEVYKDHYRVISQSSVWDEYLGCITGTFLFLFLHMHLTTAGSALCTDWLKKKKQTQQQIETGTLEHYKVHELNVP